MSIRFLLALGVMAAPGLASAQTTTPTAPPPTGSTVPPTPQAATPPGGVPRGVIAPDRPVDPGMVTAPPARTTQTMPVIKPPGTAR